MELNEIKKQIGAKCKEARKNLGLSQVAFSEMFEIDRGCVRAFESGKSGYTITTLYKFAKALGVQISYFLNFQSHELLFFQLYL